MYYRERERDVSFFYPFQRHTAYAIVCFFSHLCADEFPCKMFRGKNSRLILYFTIIRDLSTRSRCRSIRAFSSAEKRAARSKLRTGESRASQRRYFYFCANSSSRNYVVLPCGTRVKLRRSIHCVVLGRYKYDSSGAHILSGRVFSRA